MRALVALPLAALALAACGSGVSGVVVDRDHRFAYYRPITVPIKERRCVPKQEDVYGTKRQADGSTKRVKTGTRIVQSCKTVQVGSRLTQQRVPDRYRVLVRDDKGKSHWVRASRDQYGCVEDGSRWPLPKDACR